jgi:hypothetical protein
MTLRAAQPYITQIKHRAPLVNDDSTNRGAIIRGSLPGTLKATCLRIEGQAVRDRNMLADGDTCDCR